MLDREDLDQVWVLEFGHCFLLAQGRLCGRGQGRLTGALQACAGGLVVITGTGLCTA